MINFSSFIVVVSILIAMFSAISFNSFKSYHQKAFSLNNYDSTAMAMASRLSRESGSFLFELKAIMQEYLDNKSSSKSTVGLFQKYLKEIDINQASSLKSTWDTALGLGLNKLSNDFNIRLSHSDFLASKLKPENKTLASTLLSKNNQPSSNIEVSNLKNKINNNKLEVNRNLVETLLGANAINALEQIQDKDFVISDSGLGINDLPNAIEIQSTVKDAQDPDKQKLLSRVAVAQIRVSGTKEVIDPPLPPPPPPPPPPQPSINISNSILNIVVSSIKLNNNALIFEESQPLSDTNPIHLVNKSNNFYSSLSQDQAGYIKIGIGKLAQTNVVTTITGATINVAEATFTDLATVTTTITTGDTVAAKIHPERTVVKDTIENIEIATLPRFHQRYSVVSDDFRIKGITIPKGSIVVGTLLYNNKQEIPGNRQFQYYRIYDPNTGAMIKTFNLKTYKNSDCTAKTCFDMQQFATNKSNGLGARIFSEFSTEDLFGQLNPIEANKRWTLMQKDLERQSVTGIYKASKDWQLKLLKDLSDQDDVLFDNYFASIGNIEELEQVTTSIFEPILVNDQNAIDKYNHMVQSFKALVYARVSDDTESLPALRKKYEKAYDDYQNYMRARNETTTIATTSTNTSSSSSTNTPSNTNKGNTNTPAANNGPKKPNNNGNKKKK